MRARRSCSSTAWSRKTRASSNLYTADYTYLNERLAKHYGIPGVVGNEFRRVQYPDATRRRRARPRQQS
jgi:hypothetical protein